MTTRSLLRAAGILAWIFVGVPALTRVAADPDCMPIWGHPVWLGAFVVFGVAFWRVSAAAERGTSPHLARLVALQSAAALLMLVFICTGFESALLVVVAVQLGLLIPLRHALPWLALQSAGMAVLAHHHMAWPRGTYWTVGVIAAEAFAFVVAAIAGREAEARRELARANEQIARLSRDGERVRIARELHDLLGHDLVALHLNLEAARHHAIDPEAREALERSHGIAKALLDDLRRAVGALREGSIDVRERLAAVAAGVAQPKVHLEVGAELDGLDDERATALLRCVQEIVTNAAKHAAASNVWVDVSRQNGCIAVRARDDGRGAAKIEPGNGLTGMRERIGGLGGEVRFTSEAGKGFHVQATLPVAKGGS